MQVTYPLNRKAKKKKVRLFFRVLITSIVSHLPAYLNYLKNFKNK